VTSPAVDELAAAVDELAAKLRAGERAALARAITLVESRRPADRAAADRLLKLILPHSGGAWRVGVSGVPGAGKSTLLDRLGLFAVTQGRRVAVLAVDPSSTVSGGSILGDKTRMPGLAQSDRSFIRPSPSGGKLGGIAERTREALLLCEAAGYDLVFVETVGVGQAEHAVRDMVDTFLVVLLAGAGDELQGMKRGILELCDVVAVNKADGDNLLPSERAAAELGSALDLLRSSVRAWTPKVVPVSALEGRGLDELWNELEAHRSRLEESGELDRERARQSRAWLWALVEERLKERLLSEPRIAAMLGDLESAVERGELSAREAAERVLEAYVSES
jgi:LAO/AO transport system kinase